MWKEYLKDYFVFTKRERTGIIFLLALIFILTILPVFFPIFVREEIYDHSEFEREIASLVFDSSQNKNMAGDASEFENDYGYWEDNKRLKPSEFYFDPNKASINDWERLGVKTKTALTIQKYLSKGGRFNQPEDIRKIYGLNKKNADRLIPYVRIEIERKLPDNPPAEKNNETEKKYKVFNIKEIPLIDINNADTLTFALLPGIGNRLANRIVNYRNVLGGFHSVEQVGETYFLPDSTFRKIQPYLILDNSGIKRININAASIDDLKAHPYIRFHVANAIVQFRGQHGNFNSIEEIKKIMIVTDSIYMKMAPYLVLN